MKFGEAIEHLKQNGMVRREGWNGKGMHLFYVKESELSLSDGKSGAARTIKASPYIMMYTAQGDCVPWLASQTDVLAEDWSIIGA